MFVIVDDLPDGGVKVLDTEDGIIDTFSQQEHQQMLADGVKFKYWLTYCGTANLYKSMIKYQTLGLVTSSTQERLFAQIKELEGVVDGFDVPMEGLSAHEMKLIFFEGITFCWLLSKYRRMRKDYVYAISERGIQYFHSPERMLRVRDIMRSASGNYVIDCLDYDCQYTKFRYIVDDVLRLKEVQSFEPPWT